MGDRVPGTRVDLDGFPGAPHPLDLAVDEADALVEAGHLGAGTGRARLDAAEELAAALVQVLEAGGRLVDGLFAHQVVRDQGQREQRLAHFRFIVCSCWSANANTNTNANINANTDSFEKNNKRENLYGSITSALHI